MAVTVFALSDVAKRPEDELTAPYKVCQLTFDRKQLANLRFVACQIFDAMMALAHVRRFPNSNGKDNAKISSIFLEFPMIVKALLKTGLTSDVIPTLIGSLLAWRVVEVAFPASRKQINAFTVLHNHPAPKSAIDQGIIQLNKSLADYV